MNRFFRYHLDHVLFWMLTIGFHAYTRVHLIEKINLFQFILEVIIRNGLLAVVIYFNLLVVIPRISESKRNLSWVLAAMVSLILYVAVKNAHDVYLYSHVIGDTEHQGFFFNTYYNFSIVIFYFSFATALYLSRQWFMQRELLRQIRLEKLTTELEYLKAQMNPHFLFNSLNTIFFQINKENTTARETLGKFSDMLRYQLYECTGNEVTIEKELAYLKNYVALQTLRRNEHDQVSFSVADDVKGFSLPPLLLIPFIENAFKHASSFTDKPNIINIELNKTQNNLQLIVHNTIDTITKDSGGIGLKNVTRRLELLFPEGYTLNIRQTSDHFHTTLTLTL